MKIRLKALLPRRADSTVRYLSIRYPQEGISSEVADGLSRNLAELLARPEQDEATLQTIEDVRTLIGRHDPLKQPRDPATGRFVKRTKQA